MDKKIERDTKAKEKVKIFRKYKNQKLALWERVASIFFNNMSIGKSDNKLYLQ